MVKQSIILLFFLLLFATAGIHARQLKIDNFLIKENLLKNSQLAVIAADKNDVPDISLKGTFVFSVNGFRQDLEFHDGVAVIKQQIERSTFIYLKHAGDSATVSKLYYVIKKGDDLNTYRISWLVLALIPIGIVLLALLFKRFIIFAAILLIALFYFNNQQGLHLSTFFETVFDGIKSLVG